jgi:hypothetical protein
VIPVAGSLALAYTLATLLKGLSMTTEERLQAVEKELTRAKRRIRWLAGVATLCIGLAFAWLALSRAHWWGTAQAESPTTAIASTSPVQDEVRSRSFVVVDAEGRSRAVLNIHEDGPELDLYDEKGVSRVRVFVSNRGPAIGLIDENGKSRLSLFASEHGSGLTLYDEGGKGRVALLSLKDGPALGFTDENGELRLDLSARMDNPALRVCDATGKTRAVLNLRKGDPTLELRDDKERARALLMVDTQGSLLGFLDETGQLIWGAPR